MLLCRLECVDRDTHPAASGKQDGSSVLSLQTLSRHECAACDVNGLEAPIWKQIE